MDNQNQNQPNIITPQQTPPEAPATVTNPAVASTQVTPAPKDKKKLNIKLIIIVVLVLLALGIAYVFLVFLPNRPENVYKNGLNRSGTTLNKLVYAATEKDTIEKLKNTELTGSFEATGGGVTYSGSINSKYDTEQTDSSSEFKFSGGGAPEQKININFLSDQPSGQEFPNIFLKVTGLNSFDLVSYFYPELSEYDGKWIAISAEYLKSLVPAGGEKPKTDNFTYEDGAALARIVSDHTKDYVLSGNSRKSILVRKSFVGTEKLENGITANRYTVGLSKENTRKFCESLYSALFSADAMKRFPGVDASTIDKQKEDAVKSCADQTKDINENDTFDLWVDKKRRLVHKVRFSDKQDKGTYVEVGQTYKSGDQLPLFMIFHSDSENGWIGKYHGELTMEVNVKSGLSTGKFSFESGEGDEKFTAEASFELKPTANDVKIEKPTEVIPVKEILDKLGFEFPGINNFSPFGGLSPTGGYDQERQIDIEQLRAYLEIAASNNNGFYPTLAQINDEAWRAANMQGLDKEALRDPEGTLYVLAETSTSTQYGYKPSDCDSNRCRGYTLEATLGNASKYQKTQPN